MTPERWILALDSGALCLAPSARVLVLRAQGEADFAPLGQVTAVQGFHPDHMRLVARGIAVTLAPEGQFDASLVQIVKSKVESLSLVAQALAHTRPGGVVMVDGQKVEGVESLLRTIRAALPVDQVLSKSHGKLFWLTRPETLPAAVAQWAARPRKIAGGYLTAPGLFSADAPDRGSELLVALIPTLKGRVADLGAGWGYLAAELLAEHDAITGFDLIEADHAALEAARHNITDPRASFLWADVPGHRTDAPYDAVVSNPPFHNGRAADPGLGRAFIAAAARLLKPSGQFFMVANRHLPYEAALKENFGTGQMLAELDGYKLYQAGKPKRARP